METVDRGFDMAASRKLVMAADTRSDLLMHMNNRAYDYCILYSFLE